MQVGDLVKFKNCRQAGKVGIIIHANKNSSASCVHFVSLDGKQMWFTTNQLEVISASR
jgi:hypothetical protein